MTPADIEQRAREALELVDKFKFASCQFDHLPKSRDGRSTKASMCADRANQIFDLFVRGSLKEIITSFGQECFEAGRAERQPELDKAHRRITELCDESLQRMYNALPAGAPQATATEEKEVKYVIQFFHKRVKAP